MQKPLDILAESVTIEDIDRAITTVSYLEKGIRYGHKIDWHYADPLGRVREILEHFRDKPLDIIGEPARIGEQ